MKVYVVMRHVRSEGDDVEGVFTTKEKAEEFASQLRHKVGAQFWAYFDVSIEIDEHEMDQEPMG